MLRAAVRDGVRYIDTAAGYGAGESTLGELVDLLCEHQVRLCTKVEVTAEAGGTPAFVTHLETSLRRLKMPRIDTVLAHNADAQALADPILGAAWAEAKARRVVTRTGASTYGVDDACAALSLGECDVVQVEYSILNQEVIAAAAPKKRSNQELVVRSVLCKGLLTDRRDAAPPETRPVTETIDRLAALAAEWGLSLPELAIRFALDTDGVDVVLVGIASLAELETALGAARRPPLDAAQLNILHEFDRSALDCVHPERWGRVAVQ
jgi:aryl-alcohol dehydrogenase-like predicted oxidoreductase